MNLHNNFNNQGCEGLNEFIIDLERQIDSITKSLSRPYFNKILKDLIMTNIVNTKTIVDFILTEQTEITLKIQLRKVKLRI